MPLVLCVVVSAVYWLISRPIRLFLCDDTYCGLGLINRFDIWAMDFALNSWPWLSVKIRLGIAFVLTVLTVVYVRTNSAD
ncbi:hypothetical protein CL634_01035 [bacterium]|nr:hypothetical protein [bacterium]